MNQIVLEDPAKDVPFHWSGNDISIDKADGDIHRKIKNLSDPLFVLSENGKVFITCDGKITVNRAGVKNNDCSCLGVINPMLPEQFGDAAFLKDHGVKFAYYAGAMANGISSEEMVIALGKEGVLGSFGTGGLSIERIGNAIDRIQEQLPFGSPYAMNLLHNPGNPSWEIDCVQLFIEKEVTTIEASAFLNLTPALVLYRVAGLINNPNGSIECKNKIIAKISRTEVAKRFMEPAPEKILKKLLSQREITLEQLEMAKSVPLADDITVEADSGGHTDNGVLTCRLGAIIQLRNELQEKHRYTKRIRIGAGGGIGTPDAVLSAFSLGAAYVVTGSINQACIEAGTSEKVRELLIGAELSDFVSTPSADMFEIGARVQVLKTKTMYGARAQKLYNLYKQYDSINDIPQSDISQLEKQIFKKTINTVWDETVDFLKSQKLTNQIVAAEKLPKKKMALIFKWYLGQSSRWAIDGISERSVDYQIWCGPAMGANNDWLNNSCLERKRTVAALAYNLMYGAAYLSRVESVKRLGIEVSVDLEKFQVFEMEKLKENYSNQQKIQHRINDLQGGEVKMETVTASSNNLKLEMKKSKDYYKKTWDLLPGGAHYNFGDPERPLVVPFNKGRKSRVWDLDGNEHLDLFCKFGALFVGHNNEEYKDSLMKYMDKVTSVDTCDLEYEVCSIMNKHIPCADMVRFGLSGTEVVQNALRLARAYTGKNRFIRFHGHYHGNADNIMGGRNKKNDLNFPVPELFKGDILNTEGRATSVLEEQSFMLPWNNYEILEEVVTKYSDQVAAVIMEPICINGGGILPRKGYLEKTKALCEKHNVVLIFDEIITGVRLGLGGAQKILGVTPHLATFGKALGGGSMPVSAIAGKRDIMNLYTKGRVIHAGTFNGYPLGLAAILSTFEIIENDTGCYERMGAVMTKISNVFIKASRAAGIPMVVQGMPTALVYHSQDQLVNSSEGYSGNVKFRDIIIREICKHYGIQFSPLSRLYANILINDDDVSFFEERIFDALSKAKDICELSNIGG